MFNDINDMINNYQDTNNPEQDEKVKQMLRLCFQTIYKLETDNGELVEKILKIEKVESALLNEIENISNRASDFVKSWNIYGW